MATDKNFVVKNGLTINGSEVITSAGNLTNIGTISSGNITVTETATFQDGDTDSTLLLSNDSGRGYIRFYRDNASAYGQIMHDGTNFTLSTTAGLVKVSDDLEVTGTISSGAITADGLTVDTTTLVVDSTNNRVGIGTSSPSYPLEVQSGGVGTVLRAGTSFVSIDPTGSESAPSLIFNGDANTGIWRPASDTLAVSTGGTERMRIGTTAVDVNVFLDLNDNYITGVNSYRNVNGTEIIDANNTSYTIFKSYAGATRLWLGESATYLNNTNFYFRDASSNHLLTLNSSGLNIRSTAGGLLIEGTEVIDSSRNLTNIGTISSGQLQVNTGATNTTAVFQSTDDKAFIRIKDDDTDAHLIAKDGNFSIADDSGTFDTFRVDLDTGNVDISGTFDSASITATDSYGGGSGDFTNVTTPPLKISAEGSYWRIPHISGDSTISGAYNYETGKDVYWGESGDTGLYRFRGRNLRIEGGSLQIGSTAVIDSSRNIINANTVGIGTASVSSGYLLHLKSTADAAILLEADTDNVTETDNPRIQFSQDAGAVQGRIGYTNGANTFEVINEYNDSLILGQNNLARLTLTASDGLFDVNVNTTSGHGYQVASTTVIDSSRNLTNIGTISCSDSITLESGGLILGEDAYSASSVYVGMKSALMTGTNDYMIISAQSTAGDNGHTYVSAKDGQTVYIRGGGNNSSNQIRVPDASVIYMDTSNLSFSGNLQSAGTTVIDSSRNLTNIGTISSGNITAGDSSTAKFLRAHYNDGAYMTLEGYGLEMNRGASYIRPTSDGDKTLYIGGADASLDWSAIYFRSVNGLYITGTRFIDASRNLSNIGTIAAGKTVLSGTGSSNTYSGVLKTVNTSNDQWGHITLGGSATNSVTDNYYLIGRGTSVSDRQMSFHIPNDGNYGDSTQPIFRFASSGSDTLMTITAETGAMYVKGILTLGIDTTDALNFSANSTSDNRGIAFNGRTALTADYNDGWLRINNQGEFGNGIYTPSNFRSDGNVRGANFSVSTTTVIDSSRNLTNIGTISSTYFGTSSNVASTGDGGLQMANNTRLGFDQSGTRSWTMKAASGYFNVYSGDGAGDFNLGGSSMGLRINGTRSIDSSRNVYANYSLLGRGFRSSNRGELHLNATGSSDVAEIFFGYGDGYTDANIRWGISDRGSANDQLIIYRGPDHGGFTAVASFDASSLNMSVTNGYQVNGTTVIDSGRSLTNINSIANTGGAKLEIQNGTDGGSTRGIYMWTSTDANWVIYMGQSGSGKSASGGTACQGLDGRTSHAIRYRVNDSTTQAGHLFENKNEEALFQIQPDTGNIFARGNMTAYASDERLKTNIKTIENPIEKIKKIRGVEFDWLDNIEETHQFKPKCKRETGVIAQEIEEVIPDAISPAPFNNEYKTVEKDKIVALLIEAIKDQQKQIEELKEEVSSLRSKN